MCLPFLGFVFDDDTGILPLPAHPFCDCYYQPDIENQPTTNWTWNDMPPKTRRRWIQHTAWLLRENQPIPPLLKPLIPDAIIYNQERKKRKNNNMNQPPKIRLNTYATPGRVDPEQHIIHDISVAQGVEALGHGFLLDATSLNQIADLGNAAKNGIKSRFTHPGLSADGLGKLLGRVKNFRVVANQVLSDLHLSPVAAKSPSGDLRAYVETLAADEPDMFGMSVVICMDKIWLLSDGSEIPDEDKRPESATTKLPIARIKQLDAIDAVDEPAANRDGIYGAFSKTTSVLATHIYDTLDKLLAQHDISPNQLPALLTRYYTTPEKLPANILEFANTMAENHNFSPSQINSFINRYVQARLTRPLTIGGKTDMTKPIPVTEPIPLQELSATNQTADPPTTAKVTERTEAPVTDPANPISDQLAAIRTELNTMRQDIAKTAEESAVDLPQRPRAGIQVAGGDEPVRAAVAWLFGDPEAELPAPTLRNSAEIYRLLTGDVYWRGIFNGAAALATANPTTLPGLAVDAMNKVIIAKWNTLGVYRWFEQIVEVQPNNGTLHDMNWLQYGGLSNLSTVDDGAAYTEKTVGDSKETDSFIKYGNYVGITRKMLRNSEIAQIQAIPNALAVAAIRTRSAKIAAIFTANSGVGPTLDQDSVALFHTASHANLLATAYSISAWKAARLECFKQTELTSGLRQGLWPKFWLGPADLYDTALIDFGYGAGAGGYTGIGDNDVNPYAISRPGDPRPIPIAVPEFTDANDWAYLADPAIAPIIQMSYSQNPGGNVHPLPELFSVVNEQTGLMFTNDTMPIKIRDEYAYGVATYRGIGKRNVT